MDKFKLIQKFSKALTSTLELAELANVINNFAVVELGAEQASVIVENFGKYPYSISRGMVFDEIENQTLKYLGRIGKGLKISRPDREYMFKDIRGIRKFFYTIISLPLATKGRFLGSVNLYFDKSFNDDLMDFLSLFAELSSASIMNSLSYKSLEAKSRTDKLTTLFNRESFDTYLQSKIEECRKTKSPVSVMLFDIDNFKEYNDTKGHQSGDSVLFEIGVALRELLEDKYPAFRYGGEELAVVLHKLRPEDSFEVAEKIRKGIEDSGKVTVSIGLVTCLNSSCSSCTMIGEADKALYKAKKEGKNRVASSLIIDKAISAVDIQCASQMGKKMTK